MLFVSFLDTFMLFIFCNNLCCLLCGRNWIISMKIVPFLEPALIWPQFMEGTFHPRIPVKTNPICLLSLIFFQIYVHLRRVIPLTSAFSHIFHDSTFLLPCSQPIFPWQHICVTRPSTKFFRVWQSHHPDLLG